MRAHRSLLVAALALSAAAVARPLAAQAARAEAPRADVVAAPAVRPLAVYRLGRTALAGLPGHVTVSDSAGTLVARYRAPGANREQPMTVTVMQTDLVLQAETAGGLLTLLLERQNDASSAALTGRWWLGAQEGVLRATRDE
ncbi:hypothetical protein [Roseisolibacter sp. H3M3-2]|uniref:hypothetical protein n=1 Tax=Roseisolibacter sp. H3M3-2 TaxID=3031323 RepID=UPI0023DAEF8B|nr:hypothetical protein [Roseisolibacter sp. H3M3-2]MDF1503661.1 hypothetical protein [Roseisolibacter sp. H3M3-2]